MVADVPLCSSPQIGRIVRTGPLASQSERRRANGRRASVSPAGIAHPRIWRASRSAHHRHQRASRIDESGGRRATKVLGCSRTAMAQPSPANVFDHQARAARSRAWASEVAFEPRLLSRLGCFNAPIVACMVLLARAHARTSGARLKPRDLRRSGRTGPQTNQAEHQPPSGVARLRHQGAWFRPTRTTTTADRR